MPKPLAIRVEFVKWRLDADDMDLIRTVHGTNLNDFARALLRAYANQLRARMHSTPPTDPTP